MTAPRRHERLLSGHYSFRRDTFEAAGGREHCEMEVQSALRRDARARGHQPVGKVSIGWYDHDPGAGLIPVVVGDADPERVWCRALVPVSLGAAGLEVGRPVCGACASVVREAVGGARVCPVCDSG